MKANRITGKAMLVMGAALVLVITGCGMPNAPTGADNGAARATNYYQCWIGGNQSGVTCTNDAGGRYRVNWNTSNDWVAGKGWNPCNNANIQWTGGCTGCNYFGVYGWLSSPLVEYYVGRGGGASAGSYSTSKGSYTLNSYNCNGPNITGNGNFVQYNCSGSGSSPVNLAEHFQGWRSLGKTVTTQNYCMVASEAWSGSGSADVTVSEATGGGSKTWQALGSGTNDYVYALTCNGNTLYAGGFFTSAGGTAAARVAQYGNNSWSSVGSGMDNYVEALACNPANGALFAGGAFSSPSPYFARYLYGSWSGYGTGMDSNVRALAFGSNRLYAGGYFSTAGGVAVNQLAQWNGRSWSALGSFGSGKSGVQVTALAASGSNLYVSWSYRQSSGGRIPTTIHTVSRWNGSSWTDLGTFNDYVGALAVSGNTLYAGGGFTKVGNTTINAIARYSYGSWSALGSGVSGGWVSALVCDSTGTLYAGGAFGSIGGTQAHNIAAWNGSSWSALGSGTNAEVRALALDSNGNLYAGGYFTSPGNHIAAYK